MDKDTEISEYDLQMKYAKACAEIAELKDDFKVLNKSSKLVIAELKKMIEEYKIIIDADTKCHNIEIAELKDEVARVTLLLVQETHRRKTQNLEK